jgi:hypothetical protein
MTIAEETLMAYVDGELDPTARAEVEAAMRDDPQLEQRVARHRDLREKIQRAYAAELTEAVPERLLAAARKPVRPIESNVVELKETRAAIVPESARGRFRRPQWRPIASMAASLLIGVGVGFFAWRHSDSIMMQNAGDALVASGPLARGLSAQLAGDRPAGSAVEIRLSFVAKSGDYCRTFTISADVSSAGLACRHAKRWEIRLLTQPGAVDGGGPEYRTASSALAPAIITAVEEQISGEPLDRDAEMEARKKEWQRAMR